MKTQYLPTPLFFALFTIFLLPGAASAAPGGAASSGGSISTSEPVTQAIELATGWNIVSTPQVLESHSFSAPENATNFDIYALDASQPAGWATMADLGQSEFTPLYGYFINNKTGSEQVLTFNYATSLDPSDKLFERTFGVLGWYSIGVANGEYAKLVNDDRTDTDNPSKILSLLDGDYDTVVDFTDAEYEADRNSVALTDPWKAAVSEDINSLNDLRNTKGYAVYISEDDARYNGLQNDASPAAPATNTLEISPSAEDPDATTFGVESDEISDWSHIFSFALDADDSTQDIDVNTIEVDVMIGTATFDDVVSDARLMIDGSTYSVTNITNGATATGTLSFDTSGLTLEVGEELVADLEVLFGPLNENYDEGETISVRTNAGGWSVESIGETFVTGSVNSDTHTLLESGAVLEPGDTNTDTQGENGDVGKFDIEFDVTAFETDIYISAGATETSGTDTETGANFSLQGPSGFAALTASTLSSTADKDTADVFAVREGETETFKLSVTVDTDTAGQYRVLLDELWFSKNSDGVTDAIANPAEPASVYRTNFLHINTN